jgi:hypothetical protein
MCLVIEEYVPKRENDERKRSIKKKKTKKKVHILFYITIIPSDGQRALQIIK